MVAHGAERDRAGGVGGAAIGLIGGWLLRQAARRGWSTDGSNSGVIPAKAGIHQSGDDLVVQVSPLRIAALDELDLPGASPLLELLLAQDRALGISVCFKVDQLVYPILGGKSLNDLFLVLPHALSEL